MPIEAKLIDDGIGIEVVCSGSIHGKDVIAAQSETPPDDILKNVRYLLIDYSEVEQSLVSTSEVTIIAQNDRKFLNTYPDIYMIAVVPNEIFQMLSGLWVYLMDVEQSRVKRFERREDADDWIRNNIKPD